MNDSYLRRQKLNKVLITLLILLLIGVIGAPVFAYFRIKADARIALREAKNVNIAFRAVITEYYASDSVFYDPSREDGMSQGVAGEIKALADQNGDIRVTSYDTAIRKVTGFEYRTGNYEVIYTYDKKTGDSWKVNYLVPVLQYDKKEGK